MKKQELELVISSLKEIKTITDKQEYNVSTLVNMKYNDIIKILDKELERLNTTKVEVNCPKIIIMEAQKSSTTTFTEAVNKKLEELMLNDYKIIDYGFIGNDITHAYIKYTT